MKVNFIIYGKERKTNSFRKLIKKLKVCKYHIKNVKNKKKYVSVFYGYAVLTYRNSI